MENIKGFFAKVWAEQRSACLGVLIGISIALVILLFGFWQSVFLCIFGLVGFLIGARIDSKENFQRMMQRIFGEQKHS